MKRSLALLPLFVLAVAGAAFAQAPADQDNQPGGVNAQQTPALWLYQQEIQRHDDPQQAVRRKAELKSAQRRDRIAARKWYGYSNIRPTASPTPFSGSYSPSWVGNGYNPFEWIGGYPHTTVYLHVHPPVRY